MQLELSGSRNAPIPATETEIAALFDDPDTLFPVVSHLLHDTSTPRTWVIGDVSLGPVRISPAVGVEVADLTVRGTPLEGRTPTRMSLVVSLTPTDGQQQTTLVCDWEVAVEVPGPQFIARTVQPVVAAGVGRGADHVIEAFRDWFA